MRELLSASITGVHAHWVVFGLLALAALVALHAVLHPQLRRATVKAAVGAVVTTVLVWLVLEVVWKPFPDHVPLEIYVAGGVAAFVVAAAIAQRGRRIPVGLAAVVAIVCGLAVANFSYQQYPTLESLDPAPKAVEVSYAQLPDSVPMIDGRPVGALVTLDLPGEKSGFHARPAKAYVPPAYFAPENRGKDFPLLVLMAGNPGRPVQWFGSGGAENTLDEYQLDHGGFAPIVVSVDATGSFLGNPICVDGPKDKVQTYLAVDVPAELERKFRVSDRRKAIGGLSYGGTCALQVVTNHPQVYDTFLDFSGQWEPSIGTHEQTVQAFFGGDEAAFRAVNPVDLLEAAQGKDTYRGIAGRFVAGESDPEAVEALKKINVLALGAGMDTTFVTVPGGHSYQTWREAFHMYLDFVVERAQRP
ncbi:alpha/beta hydrolase [Corynebacterium aquilae]|uniref:Esterase n=1 Tax=Corynebacterium aquilae DSM 44791 TaxID=1431546 RepID=A0A1L7CHW0_9CORY|nr:alpha/beta hydrolase-fold protein [Corynebacterium aquilae]APT85447.1 hypothetical protein CAQU_10740 [Corynebacterium aquilae DSM 44791]